MRIVKKFKSGDKIVALRILNDAEVKTLFWVFVKNKGDRSQKQMASSIAEFMKDREGWLECDCHSESTPLMTIGLSVKGNYYLQRINSRGKHHQQCQFKGMDHQHTSGSGEIKSCSKRVPLRLHRRGTIEDSANKASYANGSSSSTATQHSRLSRVLYSWIDEAGLNKLSILGKESMVDRFKLLRQVAGAYQLEKGIKASRFLWTYPDVEQIATRLEETEKQWPENGRPYALCIAVADRVDGKILHFSFKEKKLKLRSQAKSNNHQAVSVLIAGRF